MRRERGASELGDLHEREADRVAEQAVHHRTEAPATELAPLPRSTPPAATAGIRAAIPASPLPGLEAQLSAMAGSPLSAAQRARHEPLVGQDLGGVRVHTSAAGAQLADALGARAFTYGEHVVLGETAGPATIAHELAHVAQQRPHGPALQLQRKDPAVSLFPPEPDLARVVIGQPPAPPAADLLSRSPALALALRDEDFAALKAAIAAAERGETLARSQVQVPLERLLAADAVVVPTPGLADAVMPYLLTGHTELFTRPLALVMRNETLRRFLTVNFPPGTMVTVTVLPGPLEPYLAFNVDKRPVTTVDGSLSLKQLDAVATTPLASLVNQVEADAYSLSTMAGLLLAGRRTLAALPDQIKAIESQPDAYGLNDVKALLADVQSLVNKLQGFAPTAQADAYRDQLRAVAGQITSTLPALHTQVAAAEKFHAEHAAGRETTYETYSRQFQEAEQGTNWFQRLLRQKLAADTYAQQAGPGNLLLGGYTGKRDALVLAYREGRISLRAFNKLSDAAVTSALIAAGVSMAVGLLGGWLGGLGGVAIFGEGTLGASMTGAVVSGAFGGASYVGAEDVYTATLRASAGGDPYIQAFTGYHSTGDYFMAAGTGAALAVPFGFAGVRPRVPEPAPASVLLYDQFGRPMQVAGGKILPPPQTPIRLWTSPNEQVVVSEGAVVPPAPSNEPVLIWSGGQGKPEPIFVQGGQPVPNQLTTTVLGHSRLVDPAGKPLSGPQLAPNVPLVDPRGVPVPRSGPTTIDIQMGTTEWLQAQVAGQPGAQGIGIEPGNWTLAYRGIYPTDPVELAQQLALARRGPLVPSTPAWRSPLVEKPALLPWEADPGTYLFPSSGPVRVLPEPFFPAVGGEGRLIPRGLPDVTGVVPTTHPSLHGAADQIYLRRTFGLGAADRPTTVAMGKELNAMLKRGGFVEIRPTRQTDFSLTEQGGRVDQAAIVAEQIEGARVFRVSERAIRHFKKTNQFLPELNATEQEMVRSAAADTGGLGAGEFRAVIRIYKGLLP
jgi:hypothetical protein